MNPVGTMGEEIGKFNLAQMQGPGAHIVALECEHVESVEQDLGIELAGVQTVEIAPPVAAVCKQKGEQLL